VVPQDPATKLVPFTGTVQVQLAMVLQSASLRIFSQEQASVGLTVSAVAKMKIVNTSMNYFIFKLIQIRNILFQI